MSQVNGHVETNGATPVKETPKKQILLNAFDMSTVGHLSPGQWKVSLCMQKHLRIHSHLVIRTQMINQPTSASWTTGSISQKYSSEAILTRYFLPIHMAATTHMKAALTM